MNSLKGFFNSISAVFKGATGTGLDSPDATPIKARVAQKLVEDGLTPATSPEILAAFRTLERRDPSDSELAAIELFLFDFGWLA